MNISIPNTTNKKAAAFRSPVLEVQLHKSEIYILNSFQLNRQVHALDGNLWITQEGNPDDYVLKAGDVFCNTRRGKVVIEGLSQTSRMQVS